MSGGRWNYNQCGLGYEMFHGCDVSYGLGDGDYSRSVKQARRENPMQDKQISELVFDVLCLVYSADWYLSGDTGEDTYRKDVRFFKKKWFGTNVDEREIRKSIEEVKEDLFVSFGVKEEYET